MTVTIRVEIESHGARTEVTHEFDPQTADTDGSTFTRPVHDAASRIASAAAAAHGRL